MIGAITAGLFSAGAAPAAATSYESIATQTVGGGGSSSISFTSIPGTFKHLQIRGITNATNADIRIQFNSDTGSNYSNHFLYTSDGASPVAGAQTSVGYIASFYSNATANNFGLGVFDVLDYSATTKNKTVRGLTASDGSLLVVRSGAWYSTSAITSITIFPASGTINQYSQFALYGIKG